ncbi:MAG: hypothetical protein K2K94_06050, partial [Muribaculaceae bacterium]|nr:hypothetical protein [Muribaculaceae bacterium]
MKSLKLFFAVGLLLICTYPVCATSPRGKYDAFKAKATKSYNEFRKQANKQYADFIRQAWDEYSLDSIVEQPEPDYIVPEVYIEDGDSAIVTSIDVIMADDETNSFQEVIASGFNKVKKGVSKLARRLTGSHEIPNPKQIAVPDKTPIAQPQPIGPVEV